MASVLIVDDSSTVGDETTNFLKSNCLDVANAINGTVVLGSLTKLDA